MRPPLIPLALLAAVLALSACGPGAPAPGGTPTGTPTSTPTVAVTPSPTPTVEPVAEPVTCESLLSTSLAGYTAQGISGPGSYAEKLQSEGNPAYGFYEAGGVFCFVGQAEADALYAWAPFDDAGWAPFRNSLVSEDWSEDVTDAGFLLRSPYPQPLMVCYYRPNEFGACAVSDAVLDEIIDNAPSA